ncbi:uncharacterized protein G6M90_00g005370 [Metarhizium brunneum]|uniref:Uncharacterized protein n=1 Tax=Metarhizium brunneum TaxID=500148 RepID=A0A7D5USZ1_9HYPO
MQFSVLATVVAAAVFSSVAQGCTPGKQQCASVNDQHGNHLCSSCAIAIGDAGGRCITNNYCQQRDNSCTTINGSPYCV